MTNRFSYYIRKIPDSRGILFIFYFIVIKDELDNIVAWTDYHKYINNPNQPIIRLNHVPKGKITNICKMLNYMVYQRGCIKRLHDIQLQHITDYLNAYAQGELTDTIPAIATIRKVRSDVVSFWGAIVSKHPEAMHIKYSDLYLDVSIPNPHSSKHNVHKRQIKLPTYYKQSVKDPIFRDMPIEVFIILFNLIYNRHTELLMLVASQSFAGLRPSEACNMRRSDSPLGAGLSFDFRNGKICEISIDLRNEFNLRSDYVNVGRIKKERQANVYPPFLNLYMQCYNHYMNFIEGKYYEKEFGPLNINKQGKAITYESYRQKIVAIINNELIPACLSSEDQDVVNYGLLLQHHNIGPQIFRHFFTVQLVLNNESLAEIKRWRGDSSLMSSQWYMENKSQLIKVFRSVSNNMIDYLLWEANIYDGSTIV